MCYKLWNSFSSLYKYTEVSVPKCRLRQSGFAFTLKETFPEASTGTTKHTYTLLPVKY